MSTVLLILFVLLGVYAFLLLGMGVGFMFTRSHNDQPNNLHTGVTLIVCARNEEKHIRNCLASLLQQNYPRANIQLLFINDASSDQTVPIAEAMLASSGIAYRIITNATQKGKKASLAYAIPFAEHELIITRDADTFSPSPNWLGTLVACFERSRPDMIIGPLAIANNSGILWALQAIENNTLAVLAGGSAYFKKAFLCSGANLAFTKSLFERTNGYQSHVQIASGDDVLFLEDAKKNGASIVYLKNTDALVYTYPCYSFGALIRQKVRWASKFKVNPNPFNTFLAVLGFIVNLSWLVCLVDGYAHPYQNGGTLLFILLKLTIDFLLLFLASGFIKNKNLFWYSLPVGCVYPLYACVIAVSSLFLKPKWKPEGAV